jgi:hypothetical protein
VAAQVAADVQAKTPRLAPVEHGSRDRAGEQRAERERASGGTRREPPPQPSGHRGSRGQQQSAGNHEHAAAVGPRRHVGAHSFSRVACGGNPVCLVQLGHQLDLDPGQGQRFGDHLGGKSRQDRQCRPRPDRPADRGRRSRRALDQGVGDLVGLEPGKLRLQRGLVAYPQSRSHGHHLRGQPARPPAHAAPGGSHPAAGRSHPAAGRPRGRLQRGRQPTPAPRRFRRMRRLGDLGDQTRGLLRYGVRRRSRRSARLAVRIGHIHHLPASPSIIAPCPRPAVLTGRRPAAAPGPDGEHDRAGAGMAPLRRSHP